MIQEKIVEIIVYLLNELKQSKELADIDVMSLTNMGYTQSEINTAFSWIYSRINSGETLFADKKDRNKSNRFLHDIERSVIEPAAFGYLVELKELGLLTDLDLEGIIEKVMISGYTKVSLQDMKLMTAGYLLDVRDNSAGNRRIIINPDESIN